MQSETESEERWTTNTRRSDGLAIFMGLDGYVIMPKAEGLPVDRCPCCQRVLDTVKAARAVADCVFLME